MPTATINGIDVYFEIRGSGPQLLLQIERLALRSLAALTLPLL